MARVIFMLAAFVCMFQTLAAPLQSRAITSGECSQLNTRVIIGIGAARGSLGSINTSNDIGNARDILEAQLSLLDANNGTTQIADALLTGAKPAPADANARIVSGLQASLASLNKISLIAQNSTKAAVAAANSSMTAALESAQQAVAANCQTTAN